MVRGFSCASVLSTFLVLSSFFAFLALLHPSSLLFLSLPHFQLFSRVLSFPPSFFLFLSPPPPTFLITVQIIANFFCLHTNKQNKIYINILSNFSFIRISGYKRWTRLPPPREYSFLEMNAIIPKMMVSLLYIWGGERGKEG